MAAASGSGAGPHLPLHLESRPPWHVASRWFSHPEAEDYGVSPAGLEQGLGCQLQGTRHHPWKGASTQEFVDTQVARLSRSHTATANPASHHPVCHLRVSALSFSPHQVLLGP